MGKSRQNLLADLRGLRKEQGRLIRLLSGSQELAVGTVAMVRRKCGSPRCRCATGEGHPQVLFLFTDKEGRRRCKLVRRADEKKLLRAGERYRKWREALHRLRANENRQRQILLTLREQRSIHYE
jgi:hypothetical protein